MNRPPLMEVLQGLGSPGGQAEATVAELQKSLDRAKAVGDTSKVKFFTLALAEAKAAQSSLKNLFGGPHA